MDTNAETTKEKIELVAGEIFGVLYHQGDIELRELRKKVDVPTQVFDMAVGALVEKGDIQLLQNEEALVAHRTSPAPAVLPFRGN